MSQLYILEAANLFCGDHDPSKSKHLTLEEIKLPTLQAMYADHHPGGGLVQVEVEVGVEKLEATFKLKGFDPDLLGQFGLGSSGRKTYTVYGAVRDKRSGRAIEVKAILEARLGKIEGDAFKRGEAQSHDYALNEIMRYEVWFDGKEKILWDFFTNEYRVDAIDQYSDINKILRIPTSSVVPS